MANSSVLYWDARTNTWYTSKEAAIQAIKAGK